MMKEEIKTGIYQHYKGMLYRVHGVVAHSETLEALVLYETLYENKTAKMWVRPYKMFTENLSGTETPRFKYLGEDPTSVV
jgi:hypothetical protein